MGYYTNYSLDVNCGQNPGKMDVVSPSLDKLLERLDEDIDRLGVFESGNPDDGYYGFCKWYGHDDDMLRLSEKYPEFLFTLHGEGDNSEDIWYTYYKNGMLQHAPAEIRYDAFDPAKLKPPKPSVNDLLHGGV